MSDDYTEDQRKFALDLYLDGMTAVKIARRFSSEYNSLIRASTITQWINKYEWKNIRAELRNQAIAEIMQRNKSSLIKTSEEHAKTYRKLWKKGEEALEREKSPAKILDPSDAIKAIDAGIQGERKVILGIVNMKFVQDVLGVIVEEVNDQTVLNKIAIRLKKLASEMMEG
ncbi:hypothetical protein HYS94_01820 [Candidatus Daviesbacteria bacterium]|nr:hypothetical protein [Candidatus Daviesbacteria bacterium]